MIKVFVIDDHALVRYGMLQLMEGVQDIQVVGEAGDGESAMLLVRKVNPDVVLLDLRLPDMSGLLLTKRLLRWNSDLKIIVVTSLTSDLFPFRLLEAGAMGYLTKGTSCKELLHTVRSVYAGRRVISPAISSQVVLTKIGVQKSSLFAKLTDRELEVTLMLLRGLSIKEIAEKLFVSTKTTHNYRSRILEKLDVKNDVELILLAIRYGILALDPLEAAA